MTMSIHSTADVQAKHIGKGTRIWQNAVVLPGAKIGRNCNLCVNAFVACDVVVGDNVTLQCGAVVMEGVRIGNDVAVGPNVTFCGNGDPLTAARGRRKDAGETTVCAGATIGAGATILQGVTIGTRSVVEAGTVVAKNVPPYAIVSGNPAQISGYVNTKRMRGESAVAASAAFARGRTGAKLYEIPHFADLRGDLNVIEFGKSLPFPAKRAFYTYNVESTEARGEHAHKKCEQFLVAVKGSLNVIVDDGRTREEYVLDSPSQGLYLPAGCWGIQYRHSLDNVLLVFASMPYVADDYIRDYGEFLSFKGL